MNPSFVDPGSYGDIADGNVRTRAVTITNDGDAKATGLSFGFTTSSGGTWTVGTDNCLAVVQETGSCTVDISVRPDNSGPSGLAEAVLQATYAESGTPVTVALSATATTGGLSFDLNPANLGTLCPGTNEWGEFVIRHSGNGYVSNLNATIDSNAAINFSGGSYPGTGGTCGNHLDAGDTCSMIVDFITATPGSYSPTFTITADGGLQLIEPITGVSDVMYCDSDGDGYTPAAGDCDDSNNMVNPVATESCSNTIDDNCNSLTDYSDPYCIDNDSDGFSEADGDCDDANTGIYPGSGC